MVARQVRLPPRRGDDFSSDGHTRAFDARADGTLFSDGAGICLLKGLQEALDDGDNIYAVIKGTATNNDGSRKAGYSAPSLEGQAEAVIDAQLMAGVSPETIGYIEAHGTGTAIGDPLEVDALKMAFNTDKKGFCALGSIKTNIGHLNAAAGIAGLIKAVLAIKYRRIPPTLFYTAPNPRIDFENSPFYVNTELKEWNENRHPLRAGVSSYGIGGTNAHVVLEEAPQIPPLHGTKNTGSCCFPHAPKVPWIGPWTTSPPTFENTPASTWPTSPIPCK